MDILGTEEDTIYRDPENEVERKMLIKAISKLSERTCDHSYAIWNRNAEWRREDPERGGRYTWNLTILYIQAGKENYAQTSERIGEKFIKNYTIRKIISA